MLAITVACSWSLLWSRRRRRAIRKQWNEPEAATEQSARLELEREALAAGRDFERAEAEVDAFPHYFDGPSYDGVRLVIKCPQCGCRVHAVGADGKRWCPAAKVAN